jgi:very-short-patch-repair endonuclease
MVQALEEEEHYRAMASRAMVQIAKNLRQRQTNAEAILWECLRNRRLNGLKVRRQHPIAQTNYVTDFFSYEQHLVIELDGGIHVHQQTADAVRQHDIEALGYRVIRFSNEEIFSDLEKTLITILKNVASSGEQPSP